MVTESCDLYSDQWDCTVVCEQKLCVIFSKNTSVYSQLLSYHYLGNVLENIWKGPPSTSHMTEEFSEYSITTQ